MDKKRRGVLIRIRVISVIMIFIGLGISYRLYNLQLKNGHIYLARANGNYYQTVSSFDRKSIFFEKKDTTRISAATVMSGYILAINPSLIPKEQEDNIYEKINSIIPLNKDSFYFKVSKKDDPYEEISKKITREEFIKINQFGLPGIIFSPNQWRFYPGSSLAAHSIGFMAYRGNDIVGQYGLERFYNDILSKDKNDVKVNVFAELFLNFGESVFNRTDKKADIVTTIEPIVQNFLEQELQKTIEKYGSESANGIIINPQNGQILAMASIPSFDLNNFGTVRDVLMYSNPLVENVYEFGSVVKPLVIAAALDAGVISADTPFYDPGFVQIEDKKIENFDKKGRGQITIQKVLAESLNTGMVYTMKQLGRNKFREYMISYGIGERSGIDLPNEARGLVSNLQSPRELEYATASFGQGISFSPVVLVKALSSIANGGYLIQPHMVKAFEYENGKKENVIYKKEESKRVLKDGTSEKISKMLVAIVDDTLGGGKYKMPGYSIAAKTGTAQIPNPKGGGYIEGKNMHSFFGYFPAYDPEFLVFISNTAPVGARFASETMTEPFINIAHFLINYYEIPPDR